MANEKIVLVHKVQKYKGEEYHSYVGTIRLSDREAIIINLPCDSSGTLKRYDVTNKNTGKESKALYGGVNMYDPSKKKQGLRDKLKK